MRQLEQQQPQEGDNPLPDAQYHPVLTKALLVHAASWGFAFSTLRDRLGSDLTRRDVTQLLGYGALDEDRLAVANRNRATLLAAGTITGNQQHRYAFPLPPGASSHNGLATADHHARLAVAGEHPHPASPKRAPLGGPTRRRPTPVEGGCRSPSRP